MAEATWIVYGLRENNTEEYRYIGKTVFDIEYRFRQHMREAAAGSSRYVYNWIRSVGVDNVVADILEEVNGGEKHSLNTAEMLWIKKLRESGHRLTNLTDGGEGTSGFVKSPEQRKAISEARKGRYGGENNPRYGIKGPLHPLYGVKGPAHPGYGYKYTEEQLEASRKRATGRYHTQETKDKLSRIHSGRPKSDEAKHKMHLSAHKRFHVDRGVVNPSCKSCNPKVSE